MWTLTETSKLAMQEVARRNCAMPLIKLLDCKVLWMKN